MVFTQAIFNFYIDLKKKSVKGLKTHISSFGPTHKLDLNLFKIN
jgi:hypothetical protein